MHRRMGVYLQMYIVISTYYGSASMHFSYTAEHEMGNKEQSNH